MASLLRELGYSLQSNRKTREGSAIPTVTRNSAISMPRRVMRWRRVSRQSRLTRRRRNLLATSKNGGRELRPKRQPEPVRVHDFLIPGLGRAVPYGVY